MRVLTITSSQVRMRNIIEGAQRQRGKLIEFLSIHRSTLHDTIVLDAV
jgi:hypothetical protein